MINRSTILSTLVDETGYDRRVITTIVNTMTDRMREAILAGEEVDLCGLGVVKLVVCDTAIGIRRTVKFVPNPVLKRRMVAQTTPAHLKRPRRQPNTPTGDIGSG